MNESHRPAPIHGLYEDQFWTYVEDKDLRLQRSAATGRLRYPPGPVCPDTLVPEHDWVPIQGEAVLLSWTVFRRQYFPGMPTPYTVVAVRTVEGPIMIGHLPGDCSSSLSIGMPMRLVYDVSATDEGPRTLFNWVPQGPALDHPSRKGRRS